ncbi:MAG: hypothetical protein V3S69_02035 [Dehalococcoidales bacterium]
MRRTTFNVTIPVTLEWEVDESGNPIKDFDLVRELRDKLNPEQITKYVSVDEYDFTRR